MKKNFIEAILLSAVLLTACEEEQLIDELETTKQTTTSTAQAGGTTAAVSTVEPSQTTLVGLGENKEKSEETAVSTEREHTEGEEIILMFLESLQAGENKFKYGELGYGDPFEAYDFMDDFTLDDYSYEYKGDGIYSVTLNCSDSTAEMFPNGESEWVFKSYMYYFIPAEREENRNISDEFYMPDYDGTDSALYSAYCAAVDFSKYTRAFEADEEWFENYTDIDVHGFYHAYNPYFGEAHNSETSEYYDVTTEEFAAAVKKLYNINMTAEQAQSMTDETGFMRRSCGHGDSWYYHELADFEETEDEATVTVNYYGDSLYFYPVVQSEYTFSKNEDGTITLQNVEKLFDKGYELASGTV